MGDFDRYKRGVISIIEKKNESLDRLGSELSTFFRHLTTILLIYLGLIVHLISAENQQHPSHHLLLLTICLTVACVLFSVAVLYERVYHARMRSQARQKQLKRYIDNEGETKFRIQMVDNNKIFLFFEKAALVMFSLSLVSLVIYAVLK